VRVLTRVNLSVDKVGGGDTIILGVGDAVRDGDTIILGVGDTVGNGDTTTLRVGDGDLGVGDSSILIGEEVEIFSVCGAGCRKKAIKIATTAATNAI